MDSKVQEFYDLTSGLIVCRIPHSEMKLIVLLIKLELDFIIIMNLTLLL